MKETEKTSSKDQLDKHLLLEDIHLFFPCKNDRTNLRLLGLWQVGLNKQDGKVGHNRNIWAISYFPAKKNMIISHILQTNQQHNSNEITSSVLQISQIWNSSSDSVWAESAALIKQKLSDKKAGTSTSSELVSADDMHHLKQKHLRKTFFL
jgi:hypothetical protein